MLDAWLREGRLEVVSSARLLGELENALEKPYFDKRLTAARKTAYLDLVRSAVIFVHTATRLRGVTAHPPDDHVLEVAIDGDAQVIVTGDHHLLDVASFRKVQILTPRQFVELL